MEYSTFWESLINWQDAYSDGLLQRPSITLWDQNTLSVATDAGYASIIYYDPDVTENTDRLSIAMRGNDQATFFRFLGCCIIGVMPERGLLEAIESLKDIWEFNSYEMPNPEITRQLPPTIKGTIAEHKKRPDMVVTG